MLKINYLNKEKSLLDILFEKVNYVIKSVVIIKRNKVCQVYKYTLEKLCFYFLSLFCLKAIFIKTNLLFLV